MKKMSEVFELPLHELDIAYCVNTSSEADALAAHAINHVDALADALELMIDNNWKSAHERQCAQLVAKAAIEAYRGVK